MSMCCCVFFFLFVNRKNAPKSMGCLDFVPRQDEIKQDLVNIDLYPDSGTSSEFIHVKEYVTRTRVFAFQ